MARGRQCKKKTLTGCGMQPLDHFGGSFRPFGLSWPSCWGRGSLGSCSPSVPCPSYSFTQGCPCTCVPVVTRVCKHTGGCTGGCRAPGGAGVCTAGAGTQGGAPSPEPQGGKPAILRRAQPVSVQCQGRDYTGINILNSLSRPSDSKILTPAIALLPPGCGIPGFKPRCQVKWGELPWPPQPPKTPALRFFSSSLAILSVSPAAAGRRPHERFSCRLPPPNSW